MNVPVSSPPDVPVMPEKRPTHWGSLAQMAFSLLCTLVLWGQSIAVIALGVTNSPLRQSLSRQLLWNMAAGYFVLGMLFIPSAFYAFARLSNRQLTFPLSGLGTRLYRAGTWLAPVLFLGALGWGVLVMRGVPGTGLLMPLAHLLAAITPVWWLLRLGSKRLNITQSQQRRWGLVAAGLGGGPFLSILAEITLALLAVGGVAVWAGQNPQAASTLETMGKRLLFAAGNPAAARRALTHILETYPLLRLAGLTALGVFIPLVEEFFKPLGVWMLSRKGISPQEGLFSGMLSGGMFALMESVLSRAQGDSWLVTLSGRAGTSLMHIATAGLVGYALARAWQERRYLHLGASYLLAVLLHGAWNISVINFSGNVFFNDNSLQWNATTISSVLTLAIVLLISLWIVLQLGTPQASPLPVQEETHGLD